MELSVIRDNPSPDYAEFIIGPARGRTRWLHPGYKKREAHDLLYRHPGIPRRRPRESHRRREIRRRIQHKRPRLWQRRHIAHRQGPNCAHRRERGLARRRRHRCPHARKPAGHGEHRCRLQGRGCSGGFAVPAALRRADSVQRTADRTGRCRGVGDRTLRGVAHPRGLQRRNARHRPQSPAPQGRRRRQARRGHVRPANTARRGHTGTASSRSTTRRRACRTSSAISAACST